MKDLKGTFPEHLRRLGRLEAGDAVVVALSGGRDSVTLLHLVRFSPALSDLHVVAAHLDHAMRPDSLADAEWVAELCADWQIELRARRADPAPADEAAARELRYGFLEEVRLETGARWILTGHHADDQAETVLFRAARGTGLRGLRGILPRRSPGVLRPLLPWHGEAIEAYARDEGLGWREDPTNRLPMARNVLRHTILPSLEGEVAPSARSALAALARRARAQEAAWTSLETELLEPLEPRRDGPVISVLLEPLQARHPAVRARLVRALFRRLGVALSEAGTRAAVEFTSSGASGTAVTVGRDATVRRELNRLVLRVGGREGEHEVLVIAGAEAGSGTAVVGGRSFVVVWGPESAGDATEAFDLDAARLPLVVREWEAGDRMVLSYGTKKVKKLFLEARVPSEERRRHPVVADASGSVLWIPGVARSARCRPRNGSPVLHIGISHAHIE